MDKLAWIKELVLAETQMEESGVVDFTAGFDPDKELQQETLDLLNTLKEMFVDASSTFNQLKSSSVGRIKIYGIANTHADFMLFRNGFKLIFSMLQPGRVLVKFLHLGSTYLPGTMTHEAPERVLMDEDIIESRWGAFGDLIWIYRDQEIKLDNLVRYYMTRFIKESAK